MTVTVPPPTTPFPITSQYVNGGLFWREDESLKKYLKDQNIVTFDQSAPTGGRKLKVYFRLPEQEERTREFPYIIIDRLGWDRDAEREMRGPLVLDGNDPYRPDGTAIKPPIEGTVVRRRVRGNRVAIPGYTYKAQDLPIPIMIRYQVQVWTRFKRQLMWVENQMLSVLPVRFGAIEMATAGFARDDNSVRRMDFLGSVPNETVDPDGNASKRIFGRTWTIAISSEILPSDLNRAVGPLVDEVVVDPSDRPGYDSVTE